MSAPFEVLLYYKYCRISDPDAYADEHRKLCYQLGLKGRILIAAEGGQRHGFGHGGKL